MLSVNGFINSKYSQPKVPWYPSQPFSQILSLARGSRDLRATSQRIPIFSPCWSCPERAEIWGPPQSVKIPIFSPCLCHHESAVTSFGMWCMSNQPAPQPPRAGENLLLALCSCEESLCRKWLKLMSNDFFGGEKIKIGETCLFFCWREQQAESETWKWHQRQKQSWEHTVLSAHCRWCPPDSSGILLREKNSLVPAPADREGICWAAGYHTFCLHLLACWGLVTGFFLLSSPFRSGSYFVITSDGFANGHI